MPLPLAPDAPGNDPFVAPWVDGGLGDGPLTPIPNAPIVPNPDDQITPIPNADPNQPVNLQPLAAAPPVYASQAAGTLFPASVEAWRPKVQAYFRPEDVNKVLYVIKGESSGNATAKNPNSAATGLVGIMTNLYPNVNAKDGDASLQWAASRIYGPDGNGPANFSDWGENTHYNGTNFGSLGSPSEYGPGGTGAPIGSAPSSDGSTNFGMPWSTPLTGSSATAAQADPTTFGAIYRAMQIVNGHANPESSADPGLLESPAIFPLSPAQQQTADDVTKAHDTYQGLVDSGQMTAAEAQTAYAATVKTLTQETGPDNLLVALLHLAAQAGREQIPTRPGVRALAGLPGKANIPDLAQKQARADLDPDSPEGKLRAKALADATAGAAPQTWLGAFLSTLGDITDPWGVREATHVSVITPALEGIADATGQAFSKTFAGITGAVTGADVPTGTAPGHGENSATKVAGDIGYGVGSSLIPTSGSDIALAVAPEAGEIVKGGRAILGGALEAGTTAVGRAAERAGGEAAARVGSSSIMDRILPPDVLNTERGGANVVESSGGTRLEGARAAQANAARAAEVPETPKQLPERTATGQSPSTRPEASGLPSMAGGAPEASEGAPQAISVDPDQTHIVEKLTPNVMTPGQAHGWLAPDGTLHQINSETVDHNSVLRVGDHVERAPTWDAVGGGDASQPQAFDAGWLRMGKYGKDVFFEGNLTDPRAANRIRNYMAANGQRGENVILEDASGKIIYAYGGTFKDWVDAGMPMRQPGIRGGAPTAGQEAAATRAMGPNTFDTKGPLPPPTTDVHKGVDAVFAAAAEGQGIANPAMSRDELATVYQASAPGARGKVRAYRNGAPPVSLDEMRYSLQKGRAGQNWYRTFGKWLDKETGGRLGQVLLNFGVTSAQSSPESNLFKTFKVMNAWNDLSEGGTKEVTLEAFAKLIGAGTTGGLERNQVRKLYEAFTTGATGTGDAAAKTPSYARNLFDAAMGQYSPFVTADTHHAAYFNFQLHKSGAYDLLSSGGADSAEEYAFMERVTQHLAAEEGISPMEAQAALWETMKKVKEADNGTWAKLFSEGKITWKQAVDNSQGHLATGGFTEAFENKPKVQQAWRDLMASWEAHPPPDYQLDYQYRGPGTKTSPASDLRVNAELADDQRASIISRSPAVRIQVSDPDVMQQTGLVLGRNGQYQFEPLTDAGISHHVEFGASSGAETGLSGDVSVVLHGASEEKAAFVAAHLLESWRRMGVNVDTAIIENPNGVGTVHSRTLEKHDRSAWTHDEMDRLDQAAWKNGLQVRSVTSRGLEHISLLPKLPGDVAALGKAHQTLRDAKIEAAVYDSIESQKFLGGGDGISTLDTLSSRYDPDGTLHDRRENTRPIGAEGTRLPAAGEAGPHPGFGEQARPRRVPIQDDRYGDFPTAAGGAPESADSGGGPVSRTDAELVADIDRAAAARPPAPAVKGPLDTAIDKLLEGAKREANLRRSGTPEREIRQGRAQQFANVRDAAQSDMDFGARQDLAADAARVGTLRRTFIDPIELDPEELNAVGNALADMVRTGDIHPGQYMQMILPRNGRPSILENMQSERPNLQPHEVALVRQVFGEEIAAGQELRVRAAKNIEPTDAQIRAETEKLNAMSQVQADKAERAAYIKLHKALEARDEKEARQAQREIAAANQRARGAALRQYMDSEKEMDDAWKAAKLEQDKAQKAFEHEWEAGKHEEETVRARQQALRLKALKAFDEADQLEQRVTRAYIEEAEKRNARAALGQNVQSRLGLPMQRTQPDGSTITVRRPATAFSETDVNWPKTRQAQAQSTYGKNWAQLSTNEKLQIATDHGGPEPQRTALEAAHQEALDAEKPNYVQLYQKLADQFVTYDEAAKAFVPTYSDEERDMADLAARIIKHQLEGTRLMVEKMTPAGGLSRALYLTRAVFSGDLKDAYLNLLQRRLDALESGLRMAGMDEKFARATVRLLRDADIAERYGAASGVNRNYRLITEHGGQLEYDVADMVPGHSTEVPESITKALAEMKNAPNSDTFNGLDKAVARWKNTVFAVDAGVLGVHLKAAIDRGGITGVAGLVNRTLAALSMPHAALYSAEVNIPRLIQDVLDGGHPGTFGSAVTTNQGTMLTYLTDRLGEPGKALDTAVTRVVDLSNEKLFGNIMGWIRDVNFEGNLAVLHLLGRNIYDPQVRYTAMQFANATSSMADVALNSTRRSFERKGLTAPSMMRGEVANLLQMLKFFRPDATAEERILAATLIGSRMVATLVVGAAIAAVIGVGEYQMNPLKPGFGQITTRLKDSHGRNVVLSIFPQESLVKAFVQSIDVLAEQGDVKKASETLMRAFVGRASLVGQTLATAVGTGYDADGKFHTGDLNKGMDVYQQAENLAERTLLSPFFASIVKDPDLIYNIMQGVGQAGFPESTSHLKNREAVSQYVYDPSAEGGQRLRNQGEQGEGVPYSKLLPTYKLAIDNSDTVKSSAETFKPTDYKAAFNSERAKYDAQEQDNLEHWREGTLAQSMPKNWNDLGLQRQASSGALQVAFAKELGGIPPSRVESITQKYYSDDYIRLDPETHAIDYDATAAARQTYMEGLSTKRKGNEPSDYEIMTDWLKRIEAGKTQEHADYDSYIAQKKLLGYFDPNLSPQGKAALDQLHPEIEADNWKWNGGVIPPAGQNDTTPSAHSAAAVNLELAMQGDFPNRPVKMNGFERDINESPKTEAAWKVYGPNAAEFVAGYPNDAEFNADRARVRPDFAARKYGLPYSQLADWQRKEVESSITSQIKDEVLKSSPRLEAYLAWMGERKSIGISARPALDDLRHTYGMEPLFKDGSDIRQVAR